MKGHSCNNPGIKNSGSLNDYYTKVRGFKAYTVILYITLKIRERKMFVGPDTRYTPEKSQAVFPGF